MAQGQSAPRALLLLTGVFANGGIQRFNQTLAAALSSLDVECDVLSLQDSPSTVRNPSLWNGVHIRGFAGDRVRFSLAAMRFLWKGRYDWLVIGHINFVVLAGILMVFQPFTRTRALLIAHGIEVWSGLDLRRRWALRRLQTILCVSGYTRRRIVEQVRGLARQKLRIFPNALGASWGQLSHATRKADPPPPYLLSVTRLEKADRYKGILTTIEAVSMLEDASITYVVVGQGNDLPFLELAARRFGVVDRVHFLKGISDGQLVDLYRNCEAFVLPSGKEGFGIVFLEAMFFGAPVIAAEEKGALDVVRDEENGLLVRYGDAIGLTRAIQRITTDDALRHRLQSAGRLSVTGDGEFTFQRFIRNCHDVFGGTYRPVA